MPTSVAPPPPPSRVRPRRWLLVVAVVLLVLGGSASLGAGPQTWVDEAHPATVVTEELSRPTTERPARSEQAMAHRAAEGAHVTTTVDPDGPDLARPAPIARSGSAPPPLRGPPRP